MGTIYIPYTFPMDLLDNHMIVYVRIIKLYILLNAHSLGKNTQSYLSTDYTQSSSSSYRFGIGMYILK